MEKITKRNMFVALTTLATEGTLTYTTDEGVVEVPAEALLAFAQNEIELLDKKAAQAKERAAAKRAEADELTETVAAVMTGEFESIADIAARVEGEEVTANKVGYRLRKLVELGRAEKGELTIPATETSKARKIVAYRAI